MWKRLAILSVAVNALLLGLLVLGPREKLTRFVRGRISLPLLDFDPLLHAEFTNTRLVGIDTEDGGHQSCRVTSVEALLDSPANKYGNSPAMVVVEMEDSKLGARCRSIATVDEGWVATPK